MRRIVLVVTSLSAGSLVGLTPAHAATTYTVLFDDTSAQTAGNADWIPSTSMPDPLAQNPSPTTEKSWTGALSAWGVALQRSGRYSLKTLPRSGSIRYGNSANALELSHFNAFVLPEPNVLFTAAEKTAIVQYVQAGGGLFMISDHNGSDRNNDGADSVAVLNDLMTDNSVDASDPFGFSIDKLAISNDNPAGIGRSGRVVNGPFGLVTGTIIRDGTTATLHTSAARGEVYRTGSSTTGTTGVAFATSTFGSGRVAFWGDSSPMDDGAGQSGNDLYDGWDDPAGTDATLALNATEWLAGGAPGGGGSGGTERVTNPTADLRHLHHDAGDERTAYDKLAVKVNSTTEATLSNTSRKNAWFAASANLAGRAEGHGQLRCDERHETADRILGGRRQRAGLMR